MVIPGSYGPEPDRATWQRSARSLYIAERALSMHGLTRGEMFQMYCKDRNGVRVFYQEREIWGDITQG